MHLYETHLPVADTRISEKFYREIVGLPFAYRDSNRDIVFVWADAKEKGMIGLWGPDTAYGPQNGSISIHHLAIAVSLDELFALIEKLKYRGIQIFGFGGHTHRIATEPSVIGWMPSAQIYFQDPDGHILEFITVLTDQPRPGFTGWYSEWKKLDAAGNASHSVR